MSDPAVAKDAELRLLMVDRGLWKCCLNCEHWCEVVDAITSTERQYNHCGKYQQMPPDRIIMVGCPDHVQAIPF